MIAWAGGIAAYHLANPATLGAIIPAVAEDRARVARSRGRVAAELRGGLPAFPCVRIRGQDARRQTGGSMKASQRRRAFGAIAAELLERVRSHASADPSHHQLGGDERHGQRHPRPRGASRDGARPRGSGGDGRRGRRARAESRHPFSRPRGGHAHGRKARERARGADRLRPGRRRAPRATETRPASAC